MPQADRITFLVPGFERPVASTPLRGGLGPGPDSSAYGTLKQSAVLSAARAAAAPLAMTAVPGEDVVVLHIDDGPMLVLHPEHARDLLLAQGETSRSRGVGAEGVPVPVRLRWRGLEAGVPNRGGARGFLGDVLLRGIEILKGKAIDAAADFAASAVVRKFDAQVNPGVYELSSSALPPLKGSGASKLKAVPGAAGPMLVLIHGTFSTTSGTFAKLWADHPQRVRDLFDSYDGRVYALDHPTLGSSPIANAITLAEALPDRAKIHLLTHSRGGLVAEVLARVCAGPKDAFTPFAAKGHAAQRAELRQLAAIVAKKELSVDRLVRVACPSRGTLLASKRLDAYVSVLKWALELAGAPVLPELLDFIGEVARRRADPESLPGLAAQIPDSPLVQWLHAPGARIAGDLRVVAGDLQGDSVVSWLKTLVADSFYWTDNDLVVQTRSMYGGTPRDSGASFVLDQGGRVSHFAYFSNDTTANAIVNALTTDRPAGFKAIGPLSWAGESATGTRAAVAQAAKAGPDRPAVFLLPGILGSNLGIRGDRIWLGWRVVNGFGRLEYTLGQSDDVEPDGPIGAFYDDLIEYLSRTHEVVPFAFDWRRPLEEEAERLADAVDAALDARLATGQPVRLVAHSMGGLLARTLEIVRPQTWSRMLQNERARVLMLGTPNAGSWAPMQVLSGDDTFGNLLVTVGAPFRAVETRQMVAGFPGLIQLQAGLLDPALKLDTAAEWKRLADEDLARLSERSWWHRLPAQLELNKWGVPTQRVLDRAVDLRRKLDAQAARSSDPFGGRVVLVAGKAPFTPGGIRMEADGLVYLGASEGGDGRVPLASALLPGVRTWTIDCAHGDLPKQRDAYAAYAQLLDKGATTLLPVLAPGGGSRAAGLPPPSAVRSRPSRNLDAARPPQGQEDVLAPAPSGVGAPAAPPRTALRVEVVHGDLMFVSEPLLIGHYRATKLTGAEAVMDVLVGGQMSASLHRGLYPGEPGTHQVFINVRERPDNPWQLPRPKAVIVVGLGEEGSLRSNDLIVSVRQAVIEWAHRLAEEPAPPERFTLATTLIGSGGVRMTVGESAQLIAQAVREANDRLDPEDGARRWPTVERLRLIELYLDRASEAWRSLRVLSDASPETYVVHDVVVPGPAGLPRMLDAGYRGADHDFVSALGETPGDTEGDDEAGGDPGARIVYTLDTKRARTEVRAQATQVALIRGLVRNASNVVDDPRIGSMLFKLLVPVEIEPFLAGSTETLLEVNDGSAGIPWELLSAERPGGGGKPWAIRAKLLRKLRTEQYRQRVIDADAESAVLIVGEPQCDPTKYPPLEGARREAEEVARTFADHADASMPVTALVGPSDRSVPGPDAQEVLGAVLERDWRIVHIAGHGEPPKKRNPRGVVLSEDLFLGPREIDAMRVVPELVFVNCCHLASRDASQVLASETCRPYDRAGFAAGVAEALIRLGVRCVIAAGWAIDDAAARVFATTFYGALLGGTRFMNAVALAREAAWQMGGNTWAAYQCYGDPDWVFRRVMSDAQRPTPPKDALAGVASAEALVLSLQTIAVRGKYPLSTDERQRARDRAMLADRVKYLETRFGPAWGAQGAVAVAFGDAWSEIGSRLTAMTWYERALRSEDGASALRALEQLANLRAREAWSSVESADGPRTDALLASARRTLAGALRDIERLLAIGPTSERHSLCGAAYKRLALIEAKAKRKRAEQRALQGMARHYREAERIAREAGSPDLFYPAMNRMAAELASLGRRARGATAPEADVAAIRESLRNRVVSDPDFWSVVGQTELQLYEALFAGTLASALPRLKDEFGRHRLRVDSPRWWGSVCDNAVFVLSRYKAAAATGEQRAADSLLDLLRSYAGRGTARSRRQRVGTGKKPARRRSAPASGGIG